MGVCKGLVCCQRAAYAVGSAQALRDLARAILGDHVLLYTVDNARVAARGGAAGVLHSVDFGPGSDVAAAFAAQAAANAPGQSPPFCVEFYVGWLTHVGEVMANTCAPAAAVIDCTCLGRS